MEEEIKSMLETVKAKVLPSEALNMFFRSNPFSSTLGEDAVPPMDSPFAHGLFVDVIAKIAKLPLDPSEAWDNQGLGMMIQKSHCRWRDNYVTAIRRIVDTMFPKDSTQSTHGKARKLFLATEVGAPCRLASCASLLGVFAALYLAPERYSQTKLPSGTSLRSTCLKQCLDGRAIRDLFSAEEEALVIMVIRKHLLTKFGADAFAEDWPQVDEDRILLRSEDNPDIILHDDVLCDDDIQQQDVRYYRRVLGMLRMQDNLSEESVMARLYDVFTFRDPNEGGPTKKRKKRRRLNGSTKLNTYWHDPRSLNLRF